jgi:histidyl-tRNA synthetase
MKPSIPQGTRDFNAATLRKRQFIFNTIRQVFECYGFEPLETPAMENLETLTGKYGDEGDKLMFKVLNNGLNRPEKREEITAAFDKVLNGKSATSITERALKYDLTIPFARYVAMNHSQLTFPYKRYQMQPVWRADRPQRGRYREFYQCDCDVVGSKSLLNEVELSNIYATVFQQLGIAVQIKLNNRKLLVALAAACGGDEKMMDITIAIDKLDKIGLNGVKQELQTRGLTETQIATIEQYISIAGDNQQQMQAIQQLLGNQPAAEEGIKEINYILARCGNLPLQVDFSLARGLNYYTGSIFEIKAQNVSMGSIGGGGRYDNLTGMFGVPDVPGVGISFGVDRIYDVMEELNLFPDALQVGTQLLFFNLGEQEAETAFNWMQQLREQSIRCELYHENVKLDKQFKYAEKKNIPFVAIIGSRELEQGTVMLKDLQKGEQQLLQQTDLSEALQKALAAKNSN